MNNKALGSLGEELAAELIMTKGMEIIERNFRCKMGEIDLIARDKDEMVFIEVKTRTSYTYGYPQESIDRRKVAKLRSVAAYYLSVNRLADQKCRFDIYTVFMTREYTLENISVFKNCF
ncbi:MAG: YraN family protein [Firmicutes bacterium HGW-Firmicutes-14]|nr:MAG: YraN family protein [Firmicutes bacterium HGW-Firmicutes-14]